MNEIVKYDKSLTHYGILRRSGRYPWGSGENPYQRSGDFLSRVNSLLDKGMTEENMLRSVPHEAEDEIRPYSRQRDRKSVV